TLKLDEFLKLIRAATKSPALPSGIPIYVDASALTEVGYKMEHQVGFSSRDLTARAGLREALQPMRLAFTVKDGLLTISTRDVIALLELERLQDEMASLREQVARSTNARPTSDLPATREPLGDVLNPPAPASEAEEVDRDDDDDAKTKSIVQALNKVVPIHLE